MRVDPSASTQPLQLPKQDGPKHARQSKHRFSPAGILISLVAIVAGLYGVGAGASAVARNYPDHATCHGATTSSTLNRTVSADWKWLGGGLTGRVTTADTAGITAVVADGPSGLVTFTDATGRSSVLDTNAREGDPWIRKDLPVTPLPHAPHEFPDSLPRWRVGQEEAALVEYYRGSGQTEVAQGQSAAAAYVHSPEQPGDTRFSFFPARGNNNYATFSADVYAEQARDGGDTVQPCSPTAEYIAATVWSTRVSLEQWSKDLGLTEQKPWNN